MTETYPLLGQPAFSMVILTALLGAEVVSLWSPHKTALSFGLPHRSASTFGYQTQKIWDIFLWKRDLENQLSLERQLIVQCPDWPQLIGFWLQARWMKGSSLLSDHCGHIQSKFQVKLNSPSSLEETLGLRPGVGFTVYCGKPFH